MFDENDFLKHFRISEELPANAYQRAMAIQLELRRRSAFPSSVVPYALKLEELGYIAGPRTPALPAPPRVTEEFVASAPWDSYKSQDFVYRPKSTMCYIGKMDGYAFNQTVPKFDPYFRSVLKEHVPGLNEELESTYMRDPCTPDRILHHFSLFDRTWKFKPRNKTMWKAESILDRLFSNVKVEPIDLNYAGFERITDKMDLTSSPGLPLRRQYATQADCLGFIWDKSKRLNHFAKFLPPPWIRAPPCMIGQRPGLLEVAELETKVKARGVWAYPAEVKVLEMRYVIPLMERLTEKFGEFPYPSGVNATKALPMVIDHLLQDGGFGCVTDISKLDTSVGPDWLNWAWNFLKERFIFGDSTSGVTRNENVFEFLRYYFIRTPILLPSGQLVRKMGGIPSGSGFTQLIGTLVTLLSSIYCLLRLGTSEESIINKIFAVGDDLAFSTSQNFDISKFCEEMGFLGYTINQSKVMFSNKGIELKFLGYSKWGGFVYRDTLEFLKTAFFPEKFIGNVDRARQRLLGQLVAGAFSSAAFGWLVKRLFDRDLTTSIPDYEVYIPGARFLRQVLGITSIPRYLSAQDLFYLA